MNIYKLIKDNFKGIQISLLIFFYIAIYENLKPGLDVGREGIFAYFLGLNVIGLLLLGIGIFFIWFPEPITTMTGFVMVGISILIFTGGNFILAWMVNNPIFAIIIGAVALFLVIVLKGGRR